LRNGRTRYILHFSIDLLRTNVEMSARSFFKYLWYVLCVGFIIDTKSFVYISLSQTLIGGALILILGVLSIVYCLMSIKRTVFLGKTQILILTWMIYICGHAYFIQPEIYKFMYLEECLLLLLILPNLIRSQVLSRRIIENGLLVMNGLQIGCLLFQALGLSCSYNSLFPITGFCDNPNVSAILLAVCLPIFYRRMRTSSYRILWLALILLSFAFIIVLKCRTAYLYLAVVVAVRAALSEPFKRYWKEKASFGRSAIVVFSIFAFIFSGLVLYRSKQASADGRLLIWKVSTMMIQEHPMGIGIGMFDHDYNLRQGEYFANGESTELERYNSGTVYMAYNDFLEQGVEAGIPGLLFLLAFYGYLMVVTYRRKDTELFSIFIAFFLMSWFNFIYSSIQPWIVLMAYASLAICEDKNTRPTRHGLVDKIIATAFLVLCLGLLCRHVPLLYSQIRLKQLQAEVLRGDSINLSDTESLAVHIGTSEAYYRFLAEQYIRNGELGKALQAILTAKQYTSAPEVYFSAFDCYDRMGKTEEGIPYIEQIRRMLPHNLTSRLVLLTRVSQVNISPLV